jgi:hypothetical protein
LAKDSYFLTAKNVIVMTASPPKLIWFDTAGTFEREIFLPNAAEGMAAVALLEGVFYFHSERHDIPRSGEPGKMEVPWDICAYTEISGALKPLTPFPIEGFFYGCTRNGEYGMRCGASLGREAVVVSCQEKYLAVAHTKEYGVKIFNPSNNTVRRELRRVYERVKKTPAEIEKAAERETALNSKPSAAPDELFKIDIFNIFTSGDEVWVVTSTRDEAKGVLIDLFDGGGIYKDSFYLKLPELALNALVDPRYSTLAGNSLYAICSPKDQNDTCVIRKYLIEK